MKTKKKNAASINFIVPIDVYPFDVMVSIGETDHNLEKSLDKYFMADKLSDEGIRRIRYTSDTSPGRSCMFSTNQSLIRIRKLPETPEEFGTLAHEIMHVVVFIMDRIGMKLVIDVSDEAYAYMVGFLTRYIYHAINKYY
jgi:hypothetical protein